MYHVIIELVVYPGVGDRGDLLGEELVNELTILTPASWTQISFFTECPARHTLTVNEPVTLLLLWTFTSEDIVWGTLTVGRCVEWTPASG